MKRLLILLALAPALTAGQCATTKSEPIVRTVEVAVPTPVPCKPDLGPEPDYPDTDAVLRRRAGETQLDHLLRAGPPLIAGRLLRIQRDREKSAALALCASPRLPDGGDGRPG